MTSPPSDRERAQRYRWETKRFDDCTYTGHRISVWVNAPECGRTLGFYKGRPAIVAHFERITDDPGSEAVRAWVGIIEAGVKAHNDALESA